MKKKNENEKKKNEKNEKKKNEKKKNEKKNEKMDVEVDEFEELFGSHKLDV